MNPPTNPERQRVIDDLFDGALDQAPDARAEWLRAQCPDVELRAEVAALIAAHDENDAIFDRNAIEVAGPPLRAPRVESQIGPYRLVRHPMYTGFIVMDVGLAILCGSALALVGVAAITLGLWMKARLEEHFLAEELGAGAYAGYQARTPMLLPRITRRPV